MARGRYINASELGSYLYCRRAWQFERDGAPSEREAERSRGTAYHQRHAEQFVSVERTGGLAWVALAFGLVFLLLALLAAFS